MIPVWWDNPENVLRLASWLEEYGDLQTAKDAISFFEKPWKWSPEWRQMRLQELIEVGELTRV